MSVELKRTAGLNAGEPLGKDNQIHLLTQTLFPSVVEMNTVVPFEMTTQ